MQDQPPTIDYELPTTASDVNALTLGIVGLKVIGVYQAIGLIGSLPFLIHYGVSGDPVGWTLLSWLPGVAVQAILAGVLLFAAAPLSRRLFGKLASTPLTVGPSAWMTIVVAGVGLMFLVFSADEAAVGLITLVQRLYRNVVSRTPTAIDLPELITLGVPLAKLALGLALLLRPRWFVGQWSKRAAL